MTQFLETKRRDLPYVDIRAIIAVEGFNVRQDYGDIDELAQSIKMHGVQVPLRVRTNKEQKDTYLLIDGHRRHKAAMKLVESGELEELRVPVILEAKGSNDEDRIISMLITNGGKPLTQIESAEVVKRLMAIGGYDEKDVAAKLAKSTAWVSNSLILLEFPNDIKKAIGKNKISATLCVSTYREEKDIEKAAERIRAVLNGNASAENEVEGDAGEKSGSGKVTKAAMDKHAGKYNSMAFLKKIIKNKDKRDIREDASGLYKFIQEVMNGKLSQAKLETIFFEDIEVEEDGKSGKKKPSKQTAIEVE